MVTCRSEKTSSCGKTNSLLVFSQRRSWLPNEGGKRILGDANCEPEKKVPDEAFAFWWGKRVSGSGAKIWRLRHYEQTSKKINDGLGIRVYSGRYLRRHREGARTMPRKYEQEGNARNRKVQYIKLKLPLLPVFSDTRMTCIQTIIQTGNCKRIHLSLLQRACPHVSKIRYIFMYNVSRFTKENFNTLSHKLRTPIPFLKHFYMNAYSIIIEQVSLQFSRKLLPLLWFPRYIILK